MSGIHGARTRASATIGIPAKSAGLGSRTGADAGDRRAALQDEARSQLRLFDRRKRLLGDHGRQFGDPAWCLLLDLFVSGSTEARLPISSSAIASRVATSTAMRYIGLLQRAGLIERRPNPDDRRSALLSLTGAGERLVEATLGEA